ncbi:nucleoside deaminase [Pelomonas sp. KK5]|uniref:nucleoside deaminase n=1 Tax=Pelomonas sp. KK5 TaxID=1855730 RepID=UPI00097C41A7|nr:nucleoside deaminase [Pelomonas sp. KK5]
MSSSFTDDDSRYMRMAITASREARQRGDMPFGAVLAKDGEALLIAMNTQVTQQDCTGHAETVLVREAEATLGKVAMAGATVYASGEPCGMCAGAMFWAGITRVVWAASTPEIDAALGGMSLGARCAEVLAKASPAVSVEGPLLGAEAVAVLQGKS